MLLRPLPTHKQTQQRGITTSTNIMVFKQQLSKMAAAIKHRLRLCRRTNRKPKMPIDKEVEDSTAHCDNSLNELLECRLRQIIAAVPPQSLNNPQLLQVSVPACPDSVCKHYQLTVQTCFQAAQPQAR